MERRSGELLVVPAAEEFSSVGSAGSCLAEWHLGLQNPLGPLPTADNGGVSQPGKLPQVLAISGPDC